MSWRSPRTLVVTISHAPCPVSDICPLLVDVEEHEP
jgi:hypothetical protein